MSGRACLFCGARPVTDEHVIPQWVAKHFNVTDLVIDDQARGTTRETGATYDLISKRFCKPCNKDWMGGIETDTHPWLKPLSNGVPIEIGRDGQKALSVWAWKTSLTAAATSPRGRESLDIYEYRRFREVGVPADDCYVWLGWLTRKIHSDGRRQHVNLKTGTTIMDINHVPLRFHVATVLIGDVWLQTFRQPSAQLTYVPGHDPRCAQIWPLSDEPVWPPQEAVPHEQWELLADRWYDSVSGH